MRRMVLALALVTSLLAGTLPATAGTAQLAPLHRATGDRVDGHYIVVMRDGAGALQAARATGARVEHVYEHALTGFSARMTPEQLDAVRRHPGVAFVEEDQVATVTSGDFRAAAGGASSGPAPANHNVQYFPPWNLDRIDQRYLPLDNRYHWHRNGSGVDTYIVDTGIQTSHSEFGGRAYRGYDAFGGTSEDCNGHGTHMAGVAGGGWYGVAKGANLWSVRVLNCSGSGSYAGIIAGTDWVRAHAASRPTFPAVANYSLGGGFSSALNQAVNNLSLSGVFVSVAAGGSATNACNLSPAGAAEAFTVAYSGPNDHAASFSNGGQCVDVFAPGMNIHSAWLGGGSAVLNGSAASPHAAGVGALLKSYGDRPSSAVRHWIVTNATPVIVNPPPGTTNRLLYKADL